MTSVIERGGSQISGAGVKSALTSGKVLKGAWRLTPLQEAILRVLNGSEVGPICSRK